MALPQHMALAIEEHLGKGTVPKNGWYAEDGVECEGAAFHSPTPLTLVDVALSPDDNADGPTAVLCPTCEANLGILKRLLAATSGDLAWSVRREFGNKIRALAMRGWDWKMERDG